MRQSRLYARATLVEDPPDYVALASVVIAGTLKGTSVWELYTARRELRTTIR